MMFALVPILEKVRELYLLPPDSRRFQSYLKLLTGDSGDSLEFPIAGFNPMARDAAIAKLDELIACQAEAVAITTIDQLNLRLQKSISTTAIKVFLNLADDVAGRWTNRHTTDYDSKFRLTPMINRHFCVPYFWTSESFTTELIRQRVAEYVCRTAYRINNPQPVTLSNHIKQEIFVAGNTETGLPEKFDVDGATEFYRHHADSNDYNLIFNFLYGNAAAENLAFPTYDIGENINGFALAQLLASQSKR